MRLVRTLPSLIFVFAAVLSHTAASCAGPRTASLDEGGHQTGHGHLNVDERGLAMQGYDPVSYFRAVGGEPVRGRPEYTAQHEGATYHFANVWNLERFRDDPDKYAPAYGGWCAFAMADGEKVGVDPESYVIQDGRLMLFYDSIFADTRASWSEEPVTLQGRADEKWEGRKR